MTFSSDISPNRTPSRAAVCLGRGAGSSLETAATPATATNIAVSDKAFSLMDALFG
jgi:hypothetical protein